MRITNRLFGHIKVQCCACGTFRRLDQLVADLNGPSFISYFCDYLPGQTCVPASSWHAAQIYTAAGYFRDESGQWQKTS